MEFYCLKRCENSSYTMQLMKWCLFLVKFTIFLLKQVTQAGRTQLVKPGTVVAGTSGVMATGKAITRTVTDREVAALLKQQQLNKSGQVTQV